MCSLSKLNAWTPLLRHATSRLPSNAVLPSSVFRSSLSARPSLYHSLCGPSPTSTSTSSPARSLFKSSFLINSSSISASSLFSVQQRAFARMRVRSEDITRPIIIQRKPTTPSNRHTALVDKSGLYKGRPLGRLTVGLRKRGGRCRITGRITVRHKGGGNKRKYRMIDFKRTAWSDIPGVVERIEYDPNRTPFIALIRHEEKCAAINTHYKQQRPEQYAYILCPAGLRVGDTVTASRTTGVDVRVGNAMTFKYIPVGTVVHNIELQPGHGGQMCRAAGTSAQILERDEVKGLALLRMQSKERRMVQLSCMATVGEVSNPEHKNQSLGKAGRKRWMGIRPTVRGVAMNPVDHPHGGGEGKTSGGRPSVSKWGIPTKGKRTRDKRRINPLIIRRRFEK